MGSPWQPPLLPPLMPRLSPATAMATVTESATAAHTEDTVATLAATGPTEATMARGRQSLLLLPRLKPMPTTALTDTVDFPMEAMDVLTVSLLTAATDAPTEDMVATDVATTARERLMLLLRLRLMLTTATVMDAAMEATGFLTVATDVLTEDMEAMDVATMERGRLRLLPRLRPIPTMALMDTVDFLMEATDVLRRLWTFLRSFFLWWLW